MKHSANNIAEPCEESLPTHNLSLPADVELEVVNLSNYERLRPRLVFFRMLGQTHVNWWSRVLASQNGGSTSYIFPFRLRVLQWSHHLFNHWKNKKIIIKKNPRFINLKLNLH